MLLPRAMLEYQPSIVASFRQQVDAERTSRTRLVIVLRIMPLAICDLLAVAWAALIGYLGWGYLVLHQSPLIYLPLLPLLALFPAAFAAAELYPGFGLGAVETLRRLVHCTNASFVAVAACSFAFKADAQYSRMTLGLTWLGALIFIPFFRFLLLSGAKQLRWWGEPVIVVGRAHEVRRVIRALSRAFSLGYRVAAIVSRDELAPLDAVEGIPVLGGTEALKRLPRFGIRTVLLWDESAGRAALCDLLHKYFPNVVLIRDEAGLPIERIRLRNLGGVLGIEFKSDLLSRKNAFIKRVLDIALGTFLLIAATPLIAFFGMLVKLISPGPMFFVQQRPGLHEAPFKVWKLRTMCPDAEHKLTEYLKANAELSRQWHRNVKLINDPRTIPFIGNFMRRFSIDELPQLFNVVIGTMSLVGPRPFPEYHLKRFRPDFRQLRSAVRPGLTGMWQVMVRSDGLLNEQERYDTYYVRNWSLWLDVYLLARTIFAVLGSKGAR
jgi:Undecaprenyl-phosphate galactose phosphotransferase WbaP